MPSRRTASAQCSSDAECKVCWGEQAGAAITFTTSVDCEQGNFYPELENFIADTRSHKQLKSFEATSRGLEPATADPPAATRRQPHPPCPALLAPTPACWSGAGPPGRCPLPRQHGGGQAVTRTGHPAPCPKFGVMDPVTARAAGLFPLPL